MRSLDRLPILVAVGDSDDHEAALRFAATEALRDDRPLRLAHVIHPPQGVDAPADLLIRFEGAELAGRVLLAAQGIRAEILTGGRVPVERILRRGDVVTELVDLARSSDHVVLQHQDHARSSRVLTGHVGAGVTARCPVPVVSVPERWDGATEGPRITVGLAGTHGLDPLLRRAFTEAELRGASLSFVHAWFLPALYDDTVLDRAALHQWQDDVRRRVSEELEPWRDLHPAVDVRIDVPHMRPADALVAASGHSDLLLLGRASHTRGHLGALARALIREARCPTVVVAQPVLAVAPRAAQHRSGRHLSVR
jgi:nucleotide-binding universal stress UspA family protein